MIYAITVKYRILIKISGVISPTYQKTAVIEKRVCCSQFPEERTHQAVAGSEAWGTQRDISVDWGEQEEGKTAGKSLCRGTAG